MSNLLPQQEKAFILRLYRKRFLTTVLFGAGVFSLIGIGLLLPSYLLSKNNEAILMQKQEILSGRETSTIARSLAASIASINKKLGVFSNSLPASPIVGDVLQPILSVQGSGVHLADVGVEAASSADAPAKIKLSGTAESRETLLAFTDRIKQLPNFTAVDLPIMSFIKNANVTFTISAAVSLK